MLDDYYQQNAETNDRIRGIKAEARETALRVADLTLDYAVSNN